MGRYRSQDYWCDHCEIRFWELVELPPDVEFSMDICPRIVHTTCGTPDAQPVIGAPRVLKASIPDGTSRGESYRLTKEIAARKSESFDLPWQQRGELNAEAARLEKRIADRGLRDKFDDGNRGGKR